MEEFLSTIERHQETVGYIVIIVVLVIFFLNDDKK